MICASDKTVLLHIPPKNHPEHPDRVLYCQDKINSQFGSDFVKSIKRKATINDLLRVHSTSYVHMLLNLKGKTGHIDFETVISEYSVEAALSAAGICLEIADLIVTQQHKYGFALIRPPGHHARAEMGMGFCVINNMAITVAHLLARNLKRIAILDIDVHHGNGTQHIFYDSEEVLFIDIHQDNLFPENSGTIGEKGHGKGKGYTINIPLPAGSTMKEYTEAMTSTVIPSLQKYKPEILCVSCGFDALQDDNEANMLLQPEDFAEISRLICQTSNSICKGKLLFILEGGYYVENISQAMIHCINTLIEYEE